MCVLQRAVPVSTRGPSAPVFQGARKLRMKRNSTQAMLNGLEGKRVIITATGEGISKAITRAFLDAGAKISGQAVAVDGHTESLSNR